jgi:hypothetical protein
MKQLAHRALRTLSLASACAAMLILGPPAAASPPSARALDLGASETAPLVEDLGALLKAAQYQRRKGDTGAPTNRITSVQRVANAVLAHQGTAFVALAERVDGGDTVELTALYVIEGSPAGSGGSRARPASGTAGKGAVLVDLAGERAHELRDSLQRHLGALLPSAGTIANVEEVVAALQGHAKLAYVVLAERAGESAVEGSRVFVVPDVLRISIVDDGKAAAGAEAGDPQEVEMVPDAAGGPPLIKFEFDPDKYDITRKR